MSYRPGRQLQLLALLQEVAVLISCWHLRFLMLHPEFVTLHLKGAFQLGRSFFIFF